MISEKTIWTFVLDAPQQAGDLAVRMVPPDWLYIRTLGRPIWDTINIATVGTVISVLLAIPVAYCAARNTTPSVSVVRPIALFIIVSSRSINALIWALMPEMDGPTLLKELRQRDQNVKIIFVSGYAEEAFSKNLPSQEQYAFLAKPFTLKQLVAEVKKTLVQ